MKWTATLGSVSLEPNREVQVGWEYLVVDWELPRGFSASEDKQYCFCRSGEPFEALDGLTRKELEEAFNRLGAEGWELVQAYEYRKFYFKRPAAA